MNEEFLQSLADERKNIKLSRSNTFTEVEITEILTKVKEEFGFDSLDESKTAIAILFQQGGTARACDGNMTITAFGKQVKLASLRKVLRDAKYPKGERKLARTIADDIYAICEALGIPGNLSQKIKRLGYSPTALSSKEEAWLSDFQNLNPNVPEPLRTYIQNSFTSKQPKQQQQRKSKK